MKKERLLGLDIGDKRIGFAMSDEMGWTAQPLTMLERTSLEKDLAFISRLIEDHHIQKMVVGVPRSLSGRITPQTQKVLDIIEIFRKQWSIVIEEWDEWFSTRAAEKPLLEANLSRKKRKEFIDKLSAVIILQGYLDAHP